jgi:hypothetical protein
VSYKDGGSLRPWLEMELTRQFSPVAAPESLWGSIQSSARPRPHVGAGARAWLLWPVAALIVLLASGGARVRDIAQLTPQEVRMLAETARACDFWSDDPAEIRNWVKSKGNINVDLPDGRSAAARLVGARLVRIHGSLVAAIAYQTGDGAGALLVRNGRPEEKAPVVRHVFSRTESSGRPGLYSPGLYSWSMGGRTYEIASAGDARGACLLCHLD